MKNKAEDWIFLLLAVFFLSLPSCGGGGGSTPVAPATTDESNAIEGGEETHDGVLTFQSAQDITPDVVIPQSWSDEESATESATETVVVGKFFNFSTGCFVVITPSGTQLSECMQ